MNDLKAIKEVQRITNAGIVACKSALHHANGDLFEAVASLVSFDDVKLMRSDLLTRQMASGDKLLDEQQFVDRLFDRLEPDPELIEVTPEWRPGTTYRDGRWMYFCDGFTFTYLTDPNARHKIARDPYGQVDRFWDITCREARQRKRFDLTTELVAGGSTTFLYVGLPAIRSWSDAIAIACEQAENSVKPRVFQIFSANAKPDICTLEIKECLTQRDELVLGNSYSVKLNGPYTSNLAVAAIANVANA